MVSSPGRGHGGAFLATLLLAASAAAYAGGADNVLVVVNDSSARSRTVGEYYVERRAIPLEHVCHLRVTTDETVPRDVYDRKIAAPIAAFLRKHKLTESILYIVTTSDVPLRIGGSDGINGDEASVDSELCLLYQDIHGRPHPVHGPLPNPLFRQTETTFQHPDVPIYLVTRLAGYDFADVKALIDHSLEAANRGKFIFDCKTDSEQQGDNWLIEAAAELPKDRVILDRTDKVLYDESDVIGYASWGSNDPNRKRRFLGFHWLPGAIMTEYVSTNARTFQQPPDNWTLGSWGDKDKSSWFFGSPQSLTADYVHEGVTGASGHVFEPYLNLTPRPDFLFPAYYHGRNLAESYYLSIPALSWENVVIGDPLCRLK